MKRVLFPVLMIFLGYSLTSTAFGQTIRSKKKAKRVKASPIYSSLQLRHYTDVKMEGDETDQTLASQQARFTLGTKWFRSKLDTNIQVGVTKRAGRPGVADLRRPAGWISYALYSNKFMSITPYTALYFPHTNKEGVTSGTDGYTGLSYALFHSERVRIGTVTWLANIDASAGWSDRGKKVEVENVDLDTAHENDIDGYAEGGRWYLEDKSYDPSYYTRYEGGMSYTPKWLRRFSVQLLGGVHRTFNPRYVVAATPANNIETQYPGYTESYNKLKLKYKVTKKLSIQNETYQSFDGFYGSRRNSSDRGEGDGRQRIQNVARLSYSM